MQPRGPQGCSVSVSSITDRGDRCVDKAEDLPKVACSHRAGMAMGISPVPGFPHARWTVGESRREALKFSDSLNGGALQVWELGAPRGSATQVGLRITASSKTGVSTLSLQRTK